MYLEIFGLLYTYILLFVTLQFGYVLSLLYTLTQVLIKEPKSLCIILFNVFFVVWSIYQDLNYKIQLKYVYKLGYIIFWIYIKA